MLSTPKHLNIMRFLLSFLFALIVMQPSNMFASNKQFYKNIDYSNLDLIGIVKNKGKGEYKIRTVQPLSIDEKDGDTVFIQGMIGNFSQFGKYRIGTNLGIGFRNFNDEFSKMYGYNFFYDSEPDPGHHRIGLGLEFKQTRFGINNNYYLGLTDKKSYGDSGLKEEVLNGADIILSGLIPRFEWIETDLSYAYWDSVSSSDLYEVKLGFNFNISDYITLNLEAEDDNKNSTSYNAGLIISIGGNKSNKVSLLGDNKITSLEDMRSYNLVPVKRSEKITLEQSGGFSVKVKKSG